jgi:ABC-type phosphate transport system substrate-binding protein
MQAIFTTAERWSDVRAEWPDEPIVRYIPSIDSGTLDFFVEKVYVEEFRWPNCPTQRWNRFWSPTSQPA